jgi:MFS family permease
MLRIRSRGSVREDGKCCNAVHSVLRYSILNLEKQPLQLIMCLGPLYGIGAGMLFAPTMAYMGEWFDKKKSLAYGIM